MNELLLFLKFFEYYIREANFETLKRFIIYYIIYFQSDIDSHFKNL
jgi:hypothetical protein